MNSRKAFLLLGLSLPALAAAEVCDERYELLLGKAKEAAAKVSARYSQYEPNYILQYTRKIRDWTRKRLQLWHGHNYPIVAMDDATPAKAYILATDAYSFNGVKKAVFDKLEELKGLEDPAEIKAGLKALAKKYAKYPEEAEALQRMAKQFSTPEELQGAIDDFIKGVEARPAPVLSVEDIRTEVNELLKRVEAYPDDYKRFIDETATMAAQADALEHILKNGEYPSHSIELMLPVADVKADGSVVVTMQKQYFGSDVQMKLRLKELKSELAHRTAKKFFTLNTKQNLAIQQAIALKKLETYRHELIRHSTLNPGKELPAELKAQFARLDALYDDAKNGKFKSDYRLPHWAWDRLRWIQLWGETRSVLEKDIPKLKDMEENSKLLAFLKELPEEDRRALGIGKLADSASILGRTKWLTVIVGAGTATTTLGTAATQGYEFFIADKRARETCAGMVNDEDFLNCLQEYVQQKFPRKAIAQIFSDRSVFVDPQGKIADEEVAEVVQDVLRRRVKFQESENFKNNAREALMKALEKIMAEKDPGSMAYRKKIIESENDQAFLFAMTGSDSPKIQSYLKFRFPVDYENHQDKVKEILAMEFDSDEQIQALEKLREKAASLADELESILDDRQTYKDTGISVMDDPDLSEEEEKEDQRKAEIKAEKKPEKKKKDN